MLEAWSEVDKDLAILNGDVAAFRLSEARAFLEAMNQEMAPTLFYGNAGLAPEEFTGLSARYSSLTTAGNGQNIVSGGGIGRRLHVDLAARLGREHRARHFPEGEQGRSAARGLR